MSGDPVFFNPQAWECQRCQKINAPHASQCTCAPVFVSPGPCIPPSIPPWRPEDGTGIGVWPPPGFTYGTFTIAGGQAAVGGTVCGGGLAGWSTLQMPLGVSMNSSDHPLGACSSICDRTY